METDELYQSEQIHFAQYTSVTEEIVNEIYGIEYVYLTITREQRSQLLLWMLQVKVEYKLCYDTIETAVYIMDNYLSKRNCSLGKLQLIASACLIIGSKMCEVHFPAISEFVFLCDSLYSHEDFIFAENEILKVIGFHASHINARFMAGLSVIGTSSKEFYQALDFVSEVALWSPNLTFQNPKLLGDALIEIVSDDVQVIKTDDPLKSIKLEFREALESYIKYH